MTLQFAQKAIIVKDGRLLLIRKSDSDPFQPGRWEVPGGRLQAKEELDEGLAREVKEEVGLDVVPGDPLAMWSWYLGDGPDPDRVIAVSRMCEAADAEISFAGQEETDYIERWAWVPLAEVVDLDLIPNAREAILKSLERLAAI